MTLRNRLFALLFFGFTTVWAQIFTRITDPSNPVVTAAGSGAVGYSGTAWVDYDSDGDLDLFVCPNRLYSNNGSGQFSVVTAHHIGEGLPQAPATGVSWGDVDNDGDIDCLYSGVRSVLYLNNGKDSGYTFTAVKRGDIGDPNNRGWAGALGDYDNDGFLDAVVTHPRGFVGVAQKNHFFRNLGAAEYSRIVSSDVVTDIAPYTVATWFDYDVDGDQDLFIGSGPAGTAARDYIFRNMLKESGTASLQRINAGIIGTDLVDGQVWNWVDYDNDGDFDAYLTNYGGVPANNLYRNDNGVFVKASVADVGAIVSVNNTSLANIWADFDNDGDVDCFVTRDGASTSLFYRNNGNGKFSRIDTIPPVQTAVAHTSAVAGDYDKDGDMDLFVVSGGATNELYRNDQPAANSWLTVNVNGYPLNRSAIGAKVKAKATVNGKTYWQFREISAQNSFNGHNSLTAHIGFGDAVVVDSLVIEWLSGKKKIMTAVPVKQHLSITENGDPTYFRSVFYGDVLLDQVPMPVNFTNLSFGDSLSTPVSWKWDFNNDGVIDATTKNASFVYTMPDTYSVKLIVSDGVKYDTLVRHNYIVAQPSLPNISVNTQQHNFGTIDVSVQQKDTVIMIYNLGKGMDSLTVSLVYGSSPFVTVKPESALAISPKVFALAPKDSQAITFSIFPKKMTRTSQATTYIPKIVIKSRFNSGLTLFEKLMVFKVSGPLTGIGSELVLPEAYSLSQNYPNPFNPSTTIRFQLPFRSSVRVTLFDLTGRTVGVLTDGERSAGVHDLRMDGDGIPSGMYFYSLEAVRSDGLGSERYSETRKLVLVK